MSRFGPLSAQARDWFTLQQHTLRSADPQIVVDAVAALPVDYAPDPVQARETRDGVHAYLQARLPQMTYAEFITQGVPIASGIVESANKLVVEAPMKGPAMHWKVGNVDGMLALRGATLICALVTHCDDFDTR